MDLEILVRKARRGDKDAFLELMMFYKEYMYRTAFLYTKNTDLACDVVQECIVKSMVSIGSLKKPEFFKSWMTRILINCAVSELRDNKKYSVGFEQDSQEWAAKEETVSKEEKMDLHHAIDRLNYPYNIIIIQKYFFDYHLNEIAALLHMPLGTVKAYHARAKKKLRDYLETPQGNKQNSDCYKSGRISAKVRSRHED